MADTGMFLRQLSWCFVGVILLSLALVSVKADDESVGTLSEQEEAEQTCTGDNLGTMITWFEDTKDAAKLAREQDKLVFLIQVSGNFAKEEFT